MKTLKTLLAALTVMVCGSVNAYTVHFVNVEDTSYETLSTVEKCLLEGICNGQNTYLMKKSDGSMIKLETNYNFLECKLMCSIYKFCAADAKFTLKRTFGNRPFNFTAKLNPQFIRDMEAHTPVILDLAKEDLMNSAILTDITAQSKL